MEGEVKAVVELEPAGGEEQGHLPKGLMSSSHLVAQQIVDPITANTS